MLGVNTRWSYIESVSQVTALVKIKMWKKNRSIDIIYIKRSLLSWLSLFSIGGGTLGITDL